MIHHYSVLLLYYCVVSVFSIWIGDVAENNKSEYANNVLKECAKQHGKSKQEIIVALIFPAEDVYKCVWACFFKKLDVVDSKGMYDLNVATENLSKYSGFRDDADRQIALKTARNCASVNDQSVSDGAAGCDRSMLLVNCIINDILKSIPININKYSP